MAADLKVSDSLMAIAQSNTNASGNYIGHTGQFQVGGENLAWGSGSYDPFYGWYTEEKEAV